MRKKNGTGTNGFTLVEMLVSLTILSILGTISFISYVGYSQKMRDSVRKTNLGSIERVLDINYISAGQYPSPTDGVDVAYSGAVLWSQGVFGKETQAELGKIFGDIQDPKYDNQYTYGVTSNKNEYQIGALFENRQESLNPFAFSIDSPELFYSAYAADEFDPLELSPIIWLDGEDIDGDGDTENNPGNNSNVTSWVNKSSAGAANNPTLTDGNLKYSTTGFYGGYPGVFISKSKGLLLDNSDITEGDIFYVVQNTDPFNNTDTNGLALQSANSSNYGIGYWGKNRDAIRIGNSPKRHNSNEATESGREYPFIYSFHTDDTNYSFRDTGNIISQGATSTITGQEWAFNKAGQNNSRADFVVSEILIFDAQLSPNDREKIEGYLAHKWGQDDYLSNSHPYKSDPPESVGPPPPSDTTPDNFTLNDVTGANIDTQYISNPITVSGINTASPISITGGVYSVNNNSYKSESSTVSDGDSVSVKLLSSLTSSTLTTASLTIGGVSEDYNVTTFVADTTPDSFNFSSVSDADLNTLYTSNNITVSGLNTEVLIQITGTGAEYRVSDGVPFDTTGAGTASASSTYSSNSPSEAFDNNTGSKGWGNNGSLPARLNYDFGSGQDQAITKYTIYRSSSQEGGWNWWGYSPKNWTFEGSNDNSSWSILDTQTNESISGNASKKEYSFVNTSYYRYYRINISSADHSNTEWVNITEMELINEQGGGSFISNDGYVSNGDVVSVRMPSSSLAGTLKSANLTIGSETSGFNITTIGPDISPNDFSFSDQNDANTNTQYTRSFFVSGINASTPVSITSGAGVFEINESGTNITSGSVNNGDKISLKLTSPIAVSSSNNTELTLGNKSAIFNIYTLTPPADLEPDNFSFTDVTNAALSTEYTSNDITVSGITESINVSVSSGEYSVDGGVYTSSNGTVSSGNEISVRGVSQASPSQNTDVTLTLGSGGDSKSDTFRIRTIAPDTQPESFTLGSITDANINQIYNSTAVTISGINTQTAVNISGAGEFSINGGSYVTSGNVDNGDTITVRLAAASTWGGTSSSTVLTVGTGGSNQSTFTITTGTGDILADDFMFNDVNDANLNSLYFSETITITGINAPVDISISGGKYRIGSIGDFIDTSSQIQNGEELTIKLISSISGNTTTSAQVTIGGKTDSFDVTTLEFSTNVQENTSKVSDVYIAGNYNGLIVHGSKDDTHYIFNAPSLITTDISDGDIESLHENKKFVYDNFSNIPGSYAGNGLTMTGGFDYKASTPLLYEGSKEDLGSYGGLQQVDAGIRSSYRNFPAYYNIADKLDSYSLNYLENILSESIGINPIKPYYCNDILLSKLLYNIAPDATISASPTAYNSYGVSGIANGIKSTQGDLDYEYHSADGNAIINFEWEKLQNIGYVKIYNRTVSNTQRLSGAVVKLYNTNGDVIYSHPLWDTTGDYVIDLDLEGIGEMHYAKKLSIESVSGNILNLREVEIYTGGALKDGEYKVDKDGAGGVNPYNVYCDMTTDGGGWTRIGENYIENGGFEGQEHISQHSFAGYDHVGDNLIVSHGTQTPPSYIPESFVMNHNGSNSEYYELYFPDIPGSYFAQEIRLTLWVKGANSGIFPFDIEYMDGSSVSAEEENFDTIETDGSWTKYIARIPLVSEVDTFSWKIGKGTTGFYFTGTEMEVYYR